MTFASARPSEPGESFRYEPFSDEVRRDPYPWYRVLRSRPGLYFAEEAGAWVVSRYHEVRFVLKHPELFSSDAMGDALVGAPPQQPPETPARRTVDVDGGDRVLILMDPPRHGRLRNLVNRGFTPRRIAALERRLREIVQDAMREVHGAPAFDVVKQLALPVPITLIAELLGVETERIGDFRRWSDAIIAGTTGSVRKRGDGVQAPEFQQAIGELFDYLERMIELRRDHPREDLISTLVLGGEGEAGLSAAEIGAFALVLLIAGNETTTNLLGTMVRVLLEHPRELERVRRDRSLVPGLVEEALRYDSPVQFLYRRATREVELSGTRVPANAVVVPLLGSANRDERRFPCPDEFDVTRDAQGHLAFGFGVHFCLGAALARLEARILLEGLLDELPHFAVRKGDAAIEWVDSYMLRGLRRLELERVS